MTSNDLTGTLIIARHHESLWNRDGVWTGSRDVGLSPYGFEMSEKMGPLLAGARIDDVFLSTQIRTLQTFESMMRGLGKTPLEISKLRVDRSAALNERDYGDYTGKNKWEMQKALGEARFDDIRRGWDVPVPHGETLKAVYARVVPFYLHSIVPELAAGKNVLIVSSGNAIRALTKYMGGISDEGIQDVEIPFGAVMFHRVDANGKTLDKRVESVESHVNA